MPYAVTLRFKTALFITEITRTVKSLDDVHQLQAADTANDFEVVATRKLDEPLDAHAVIQDIDRERHEHSRVAYGKPGR
jgi:hypothetical protein